MLPFDTPIRQFIPKFVLPQFHPHLQVRAGLKLAPSTSYPAGSIVGELTGSPGTFGLTITIASVSLTTNVVTITTAGPHGLSVGDTVAVTAVTNTDVNGTGLAVASVPTPTTFTYAKTGDDIASTPDTGTVVRDAGTSTARAVLDQDYTTDSSGRIFPGRQATSEDGESINEATGFFSGTYRGSDIPNLDSVALAALGGKVLWGSLADDTAFIKF